MNYSGRKQRNKQIFAMLMAVIMVMSMFASSYPVAAATATNTGVTIQAKDKNGNIIDDAEVEYTIIRKSDNEEIKSGTKTIETGEDSVTVLDEAEYEDGLAFSKLKVTKDNYKAYEISEDKDIDSASANIQVTLPNEVVSENEVEVEAVSGLVYNGNNQTVIKVPNYSASKYKVEFKFSDDSEYTTDISKMVKKDAGSYIINVMVSRIDVSSYDPAVYNVTAQIAESEDITGITAVIADNQTYDGTEKELATVTGKEADDVISFKINNSAWTEWTDSVKPVATTAGDYTVIVKVKRPNYKETELANGTVSIDTSGQDVSFDSATLPTEKSFDGENIELDFKAVNACADGGDISYKVVIVEENENGDETESAADGFATIDASGKLTITEGGVVLRVYATAAAVEGKYKETAINHDLSVEYTSQNSDLLSFGTTESTYTVNVNSTTVSSAKAVKKNKDKATVTYTVKVNNETDVSKYGIEIKDEYKISVKDYKVLTDKLVENGGSLHVRVDASKPEYKKRGKVLFAEASAFYSFDIKFATTPADPYTMKDPEGTVLNEPNGDRDNWFKTAVTIVPAENYTVSKYDELTATSFSAETTFNDQNEDKDEIIRKIVLKDNAGNITTPVEITELKKIDSVIPVIKEVNFPEHTGGLLFNKQIEVTVVVEDKTSGLNRLEWSYERATGVSDTNLEEQKGTVTDITYDSVSKTYTGIIKLPKEVAEEIQMNGLLDITAYDNAGNSVTREGNEVFIIDNVAPGISIKYSYNDESKKAQQPNNVNDIYYWDDAVKTSLYVTKANFDANNIVIKVNDVDEPVTWTATGNKDEYVADIVRSDDNQYVITIAYKDAADTSKDMATATSDTFVIDKTKPEVKIDYNLSDDKKDQSIKFTVTEHNFMPVDLNLDVTAKDINGNDVAHADYQNLIRTAEWTQDASNKDEYTLTLKDQLVDAVYNMTLNYDDPAGNSATEAKCDYTIDRTAPDANKLSITYSEAATEKIIKNVTFGYYNPTVTVTFTGYDVTSGIDYFTYSYKKQSGASDTNVAEYKDATVKAVQDSKDKSKFTASITLPKSEADSIRGTVTVAATDNFANTKDKKTDSNHIIVVDKISPTMTFEYTEPDKTVGKKNYYNKKITAKFTVTEANFYSEDVDIKVTKNGKEISISPSWEDTSTDVHVATINIDAASDHSNDGDYVFSVNYTDRSKNKMESYTSDTKVIDTTLPVISVVYADKNPVNTLKDSEGNNREYFASTQTATVTITEHNFNSKEVKFSVKAKNVQGTEYTATDYYTATNWTDDEDVHTIILTYPGDANYTFDVDYTDEATNKMDDYSPDYFTVDKTAPTNLSVSYSNGVLDTVLQNISFGFYNAKVTVTITADDVTSPVHSFKYSYKNAGGVSSVNAELINQALEEADITYSNGNSTATAKFEIPRSALGNGTQFNGTVDFTATDRANNESGDHQENKRIVVDNISPNINVEYNAPVQNVNGISYYDGDINATITINEANFYSDDVVVSVEKDGGAYPVSVGWGSGSTDVHTGSFTLSEDGDYFVNITYTDKSSNSAAQYSSEQLTIDTDIVEAKITVNGKDADGKAFRDDKIVLGVKFEDENFEDYEIELLRTRYGDKNVNVNKEFIGDGMTVNETGGEGTFDKFDKVQDNDGIYTISVKISDKSGHEIEKSATFTVNRYGSVYEYSDYLANLIADGGKYVQDVDESLVITEYNPDKLKADSLKIEVTCDGKPVDAQYDVTPEINNRVATGESGWYQYEYTIDKENFASDGVYKIAVSSADNTGNTPENTNYEDKNILFRVDSTPPEINSITGLEEGIINATEVNVNYSVYDTIGLKEIDVYVDGNEVDKITDFTEDANNFDGSFKLSEKSSAQPVRLVVTDLAGNITDTDSENFSSAYEFNKSVTVSTNFFVRWFANKPLFIGSIIGFIVIVGGFGALIMFLKKRKEEQ